MDKFNELVKQAQIESAYERALVNMLYTYGWFQQNTKPLFKQFKLSLDKYHVLRVVRGSGPDGATPGQLKDVMLNRAPDVSRLLDGLEEMGYIERNISPESRRRIKVRITKRGIETIDAFDQNGHSFLSKLFEGFTLDELHTFEKMLNRMRS